MRASSLNQIADQLIPPPSGVTKVVKYDFDTKDIIKLILYADSANNDQAAREMASFANHLKGANDIETLRNIWSFVRYNIEYIADPVIHEDVKLPAEVWSSGFADCKSKSIMVASLVKAFPQFGFRYRFTSYDNDSPSDYTHVYVVVDTSKGPVIVDAVHSRFNEETPFVSYKDYMRRELRFIHGPGSTVGETRKSSSPGRVQALPTKEELFQDGPKKSVLPSIDISKLTQGELTAQLVKNNLILHLNYYGDPERKYSTAIAAIEYSLRNGLENYSNPTGYIDSSLNSIFSMLRYASKKHIKQLSSVGIDSAQSHISEKITLPLSYDDVGDCIKKIKPPTLNFVERQFTTYINWAGENYKYEQIAECLAQKLRIAWAKNNIFEKEDFKRGALSLLYEFINSEFKDKLTIDGKIKQAFHRRYVNAFSSISGLDRDNVSLYVKNGIAYTGTINKLTYISPEDNISILSQGQQFKGQPGIGVEPITTATVIATVKIVSGLIGAIGASILSVKKVIDSLEGSKRNNLYAITNGVLADGDKASIEDFIQKTESKSNQSLLIGGGLALAASFLLLNNKSK